MTWRITNGDWMERLLEMPSESINCTVTSPPYWGLRNYGVEGQLGMEKSPDEYVAKVVTGFREVRRVLVNSGTVWLNLGDSYAGSGKGGNPKAGKQATNAGSQTVGVLYGKSGESQREAAVTNVSRFTFPDQGIKAKDLVGIPWMVAFALRSDGWYLRSAIIWAKPNGMPGSQDDRPTSSYESIFLLSKSNRYWSDMDAIRTPPRESSMIRLAENIQSRAGSHRAHGGTKTMKAVAYRTEKQRGHSRRHAGFNDRWDLMTVAEQQSTPATIRDVWFVPPAQFAEAHFAVMPMEIARRCILAGCPEGGTVLDPFTGAGTTGLVANRLNRNFVGIELNPEYVAMASRRIEQDAPLFNGYDEDDIAEIEPLQIGLNL